MKIDEEVTRLDDTRNNDQLIITRCRAFWIKATLMQCQSLKIFFLRHADVNAVLMCTYLPQKTTAQAKAQVHHLVKLRSNIAKMVITATALGLRYILMLARKRSTLTGGI